MISHPAWMHREKEGIKMNKNDYIQYVKSIYPDMVVDIWLESGELQFYKNLGHKNTDYSNPFACVYCDGQFMILTTF